MGWTGRHARPVSRPRDASTISTIERVGTARGAWAAAVVVCALLLGSSLAAQGALTPRDVQEIERLSATYGERLAACDASGFADLFASDGAFVSGFRGRMQGRAKLVELVESERHCRSENRVPLQGPRTLPRLTVEASPNGARATGVLPGVGQYEDTYVKTAGGWRFQVREFVTTQEAAARQRK